MSFTQKRIDVQFGLANGQFEGGGNTAMVSGLRVACRILNTGGASQSWLDLAIFGLPLSLMNQLSTVGTQYNKRYENDIVVMAGDAESGMSMVFGGVIANAYVDAQAMPQVCFRVSGSPGLFHAVKPVEPTTVRGSVDAAGLMKQFASTMGLSFEDAGVKVKLSNPYLPGTTWAKALAVARAGGFDMIVDRGVMAIVPPDKTREGGAFLVSPQTGMVGYPAFTENNVVVVCLFSPAVKPYGEIEVKSDLTPACGKWKAVRLEYELESQVPNGKWFMTIEAAIIGTTTP